MVQMLGWFSAEAALASRRNRSRACGSWASDSGSLESNKTVKLDVRGFINHPHAAPAELLDDEVVGDSLAVERLGLRHVAVILGCSRRVSKAVGSWPHPCDRD